MTKETEVRFLEINKNELITSALQLGAEDFGEQVLEEVIFNWNTSGVRDRRFIRIRKKGDEVTMTYKEHALNPEDGAEEIDVKIDDLERGVEFLEKLGYPPFRRQQKKRHALRLEKVFLDIDTWPKIPTYVELEGPTMESLQDAAVKLNLDWSKVVYQDARAVIENVYHIPVGDMKWFTFDKFE